MNGIHEVTGSIPVWSTNSKSLILNCLIAYPPRRSNRCDYFVLLLRRPLYSGLLNRCRAERDRDCGARERARVCVDRNR